MITTTQTVRGTSIAHLRIRIFIPESQHIEVQASRHHVLYLVRAVCESPLHAPTTHPPDHRLHARFSSSNRSNTSTRFAPVRSSLVTPDQTSHPL